MNQLFMVLSKISHPASSPRIGEVRRGMGEEGNTTPNPSYSRRGIKRNTFYSGSSPRIGEVRRGRKTLEKYLKPVIARSRSDEAISISRYGLRSLSRVFEGPARNDTFDGISLPSHAKKETKNSNRKILLFVIFAVFLLTPLLHASAFSQCQSEKKGYCVRLEPQPQPKAVQRNFASLLFAQTADAGPPFPGLEFLQTYGIGYCSKIGETLSALYNFGVAIAGISALIWFVFAGVKLLVGRENPSAFTEAKKEIGRALFGLALVAGSYLILYTINHDFAETLSDKRIPSLNPNAPPPCGVTAPATPPANVPASNL